MKFANICPSKWLIGITGIFNPKPNPLAKHIPVNSVPLSP